MRRAGLLALEAAGLGVAAVLACAGFLLWRVQSAPADLGFATPLIRVAANTTVFNGAIESIQSIELSKAMERGGYRLRLDDVVLRRGAVGASARLPHVEVVFHPRDLLAGRAGPRSLLIDGASLRLVRRADKRVKLDFGEGADERARVFHSLTGGAYFREAFQSAELKNVSIAFIDETSGRKWTGHDGSAMVRRTTSGYEASLASRFDLSGKAAALAFHSSYDLSTEIISATLDVSDAPVGDLVAVFFNENAELLTSPVSGSATVDLDRTGAVLASRIDLRASGGVLDLGSFSTPVEAIDVAAAFDPKANEFTIERAHWRSDVGEGALAGVVSLIQPADGKGVDRVRFDLESGASTIALLEVFPGILPLDRAAAKGSYTIASKRIELEALSASIFGLDIGGDLTFARTTKASPLVESTLNIAGAASPQTVLKLWPTKLALGAREFIAERMPAGAFSGVAVVVNLKEGDVGADGALPEEALALSFRADGATVEYAPGMTLMTNVAGRGLLKGNSFRFDAEGARVGAVRIVRGEVDMPFLMPKGQLGFFRFDATGDAGDMLEILDQEPLRVLKETNFTAGQFKGPVTAKAEIARPNLSVAPPESYRYKGVANFENLVVDNIVAEAALEGAAGRLDLTTDGMVIKGDGHVGEAPVTIEWRQRFFGAGDKTVIDVTGEADSAMADLFGVPTRQVVQGRVPFKARAVGGVDAFRALDLEADFTGAALMSESVAWMKPQGVPAKGAAAFAFAPEGVEVTSFDLAGEGIAIKATAAFSTVGALTRLDMPTFLLKDAADLSIRGRRDDAGLLTLDVAGARLSAAEMVRNLIDEGFGGGGGKAPLALAARIDEVEFRGGVVYQDAALDYRRNAAGIADFSFAAKSEAGKPLTIEMKPPADGEQHVAAASEDIGSLLGGLFAMSSVRGGYGHLDFRFTPGEVDAPRAGTIEAHDIRVVKAPLLAKIFAAGSLTGLADLVNGEGIELQNARADFSFENGDLKIKEARATGPSVGITGEGAYGLEGARSVSLKGAVAPAYQLNSFLGKAPVIGDLFVNRKGEGLLALSYEVDGDATEPRVTVNPLSALAPGVFRRMFEGGRAGDAAAAIETPAPPAE